MPGSEHTGAEEIAPSAGQTPPSAGVPGAQQSVATSRLEAFSDGVFAIAITLLILDLQVPSVHGGLAHALAHEWPEYASFVTSFAVVGIIWTNHHAAFEHIARVNRPLLFLNLALLMTVAIIPFPTALLAHYLAAGHDEHVAAAVYSGSMTAMGLAFGALWTYVMRSGLLMSPLSERELTALQRSFVIGGPLYAVSIGVAFVSAPACLAMYAAIAVYYAVPGWGALPHVD